MPIDEPYAPYCTATIRPGDKSSAVCMKADGHLGDHSSGPVSWPNDQTDVSAKEAEDAR